MSLIKKAVSIFKNIHFQSLLLNGSMSLFGIVTLSMLYRALTPTEAGIYIFLFTLINLIDTVKSGFMTTAFIKFYSGADEKRASEVIGSTWILTLLIVAVLIIANIICVLFYRDTDNITLALLNKYFSPIVISTLPFFIAGIVLQSEKRFDLLLRIRLLNQVLFTGTIIVLIFLKETNLNTIIISYILCNVFVSLVVLLIGWSKISFLKNATKKGVLEMYHFGKYSMGSSLSANLFSFTNTFFLDFFFGPASVAIFNIGSKLMQIIEIPLYSIAGSGMPLLSGFYNNNEEEKMVFTLKKIIGILTVLFIGVALVSLVFAEPLIALIGGQKYVTTEAPNLFRILILLSLLFPLDRFFAITLDVINKPEINFYKLLVMLVINLIADFVVVFYFKSVYGIAITNIFPTLYAIIISYYYIQKSIKIDFSDTLTIGFKEIRSFISSKL
ncbi:MAG: oligosaccharide flippase family protein [Bacteroidetes bacterium]|nr:oligosaccharide flippase family protein [Bacteroidota bacterium]